MGMAEGPWGWPSEMTVTAVVGSGWSSPLAVTEGSEVAPVAVGVATGVEAETLGVVVPPQGMMFRATGEHWGAQSVL